MKHIYHLQDIVLDRPSVVTIGVFDGVHRGHQYLLSRLVEAAHSKGLLAVVLTLFPHPDRILHKLEGRYYLTTAERKAELLGELGIDVVVTHPFDDQVRQIRAASFVEQLQTHLRLSSLWVTADFAMGYQREGNFAYLSQLGRERGFEVQQLDLILAEQNGETISSSQIRQALTAGQVTQAAQWLGRPYRVDGIVVKGDQRGRTIGFPTANLQVWDEQVIPATGVYACWAWVEGERHMAVTNIGYRPTFDGQGIRVETHLLDFDRDIYGQTVGIELIERLRGEQKFDGLPALIAQIQADTARGRELLSVSDSQQR